MELRGKIHGLDSGHPLAIEAPSATGGWYVVDSVHTSSDGTFSYTSAAPAPYPEIMRLTLPGSGNIYFPVDSVDCVTIEAEANSFATKHHINGTASARRINEVDSIIRVVRPDDETGMTNLKTSACRLHHSRHHRYSIILHHQQIAWRQSDFQPLRRIRQPYIRSRSPGIRKLPSQ